MLSKKITEKDYDKRIKRHSLDYWKEEFFLPTERQKVLRLEAVINALSPQKEEKILEVGCGLGEFVFNVQKKGAKCFGIDYSKKSLKTGKKILKRLSRGIFGDSLACANANSLPFKQNSFDKILAVDFLEHIYKDEKAGIIKEMSRVLKPKGIAVSLTPNRKRIRLEYFIKKFLFAFKGKRLGWQKSDEKTILFDTELHVGLSGAKELEQLFEKNGLNVKKTAFLEYSIPVLSKVFPSIKIMPGVFGAYILLVAEKT